MENGNNWTGMSLPARLSSTYLSPAIGASGRPAPAGRVGRIRALRPLDKICGTMSISGSSFVALRPGYCGRLKQGDRRIRVMVLVKATSDSEMGISPTPETTALFEAMGKFNEELVKAGVVLAGDGLKPSSHGKRVAFDGPGRRVIALTSHSQ